MKITRKQLRNLIREVTCLDETDDPGKTLEDDASSNQASTGDDTMLGGDDSANSDQSISTTESLESQISLFPTKKAFNEPTRPLQIQLRNKQESMEDGEIDSKDINEMYEMLSSAINSFDSGKINENLYINRYLYRFLYEMCEGLDRYSIGLGRIGERWRRRLNYFKNGSLVELIEDKRNPLATEENKRIKKKLEEYMKSSVNETKRIYNNVKGNKMKITRTQLRNLIKEELLREEFSDDRTPLTMDQMSKLWDMKDDGNPGGPWWTKHGPTINASNAGNDEYGLTDSELSELGLSVSDTSGDGEMETITTSDGDAFSEGSNSGKTATVDEPNWNYDTLSEDEARRNSWFQGYMDAISNDVMNDIMKRATNENN